MPEDKKPICWLGQHNDEVYDKLPLTDIHSHQIGIVIINRCTGCGRIKYTKIKTVELIHN